VRSNGSSTITVHCLNILELTANVQYRERGVTGQALTDAASGGINRTKNQTYFHALQHTAMWKIWKIRWCLLWQGWFKLTSDRRWVEGKVVCERFTAKWNVFFLGAYAKLRKATISFVMSVRPSAWNNSAPAGRIFVKFDIWVYFENLSRNFDFYQNLTRMTGTLHEDVSTYIYKI
jgi:hypothetical protein